MRCVIKIIYGEKKQKTTFNTEMKTNNCKSNVRYLENY